MNKELFDEIIDRVFEKCSSERDLYYTFTVAERNLFFKNLFKELTEACLLLNEQPEAITDDAHFCKHDVSGSAATEKTSDVSDLPSASTSETAAVSGNEQTKEVLTQCKCVWPACNHLHNCRNR